MTLSESCEKNYAHLKKKQKKNNLRKKIQVQNEFSPDIRAVCSIFGDSFLTKCEKLPLHHRISADENRLWHVNNKRIGKGWFTTCFKSILALRSELHPEKCIWCVIGSWRNFYCRPLFSTLACITMRGVFQQNKHGSRNSFDWEVLPHQIDFLLNIICFDNWNKIFSAKTCRNKGDIKFWSINNQTRRRVE